MADVKSLNEDQVLITIPPSPITDPRPALNYLISLPEDELAELAKEYKKSPTELDSVIAANKKIYYIFYGDYCLANYGSCLLYIYFPITVTSSGLSSLAQEFDASATVPSTVDYVFNWPLSIIYVVYDMAFFSVTNEALKSTLYYAHKKPLQDEIMDAWHYTKANPRAAVRQATLFAIHQSILLPTNATGVMSELVMLPLDYTQPYVRAFTAAVLFFGNEYFRKYTNVDYYKGVDFFFGQNNHPWILKEKRYTTVLMALFRWAGSVGLNVFPLYFYLALQAEETLGFWVSAYYIVVSKSIQSTFVLYPSTYRDYMGDYEAVLRLLHDSPNYETKMIDLLREHALADTDENRHTMLRLWRSQHQQECIDTITQTQGSLLLYFLKQDFANFFLVMVRSSFGLYFGYGVAQMLWNDMPVIAADVLSLIFFFLLVGSVAYVSEKEHFLDHYQVMQLDPVPGVLWHEKTDWLGDFLNVAGNWISFMSTLGALQLLTGGGTPQVTTIITLLAIERMLNSIHFNRDRIRKTVKANYDGLPSVREYCGSFFNKTIQGPAIELEEKKALSLNPQ